MSKLIPKFYGEVKDGKLKLENQDKFEIYIGTLAGRVELTVKKFRKSRSVQQNRYYFGVVLKIISDHTGYETEDLHNHFKTHFLKKKVGKLTSYYSTTKLDTLQFTDYLDKVIRFAEQRLDLNIPSPDEIDYSELI